MKKYFFCLLALFLAGGLQAQELSVLQTHAPETVPFAKSFAAQAVMAHPTQARVELVKDSVSPDFAVTNIALTPVSPQRTQVDLTILPLTLQKSTFTASFALSTNPKATAQLVLPVTVSPVQLFKDKELKEIRPPKPFFDWVLWLCILLALTALICLLIWWIRRVKKDAALLEAKQDKRPPHVIALSQIDALVDSGLWEKKQYKIFYITLTDILRTYLQKAFGLDVSADTSSELLKRIKTQKQLSTFVQGLREFLTSGDLVKFAKAEPTETVRNQDITFLRTFINQTAPKPETQTPQQVEVKL